LAEAPRRSVTGLATLGNTLQVIDFGVADGRYDILTASNLQGPYTTVQLPDENWSGGIEGNTEYVTKGSGMPTRTLSLIGINTFTGEATSSQRRNWGVPRIVSWTLDFTGVTVYPDIAVAVAVCSS